jgi:hypothetical protein
MVNARGEVRRLYAIAVLAALPAALVGCGDGSASRPIPRAGHPIPTRNPPASTPPVPGITTPDGAPKLTQFRAPSRFWCLAQYPDRAQVTIGWSAPSATAVSLRLDGRKLPSGLQASPPFQVPAGPPSGNGAAVVFACRPGTRHTISIDWRIKGSPKTSRTVIVRKASS